MEDDAPRPAFVVDGELDPSTGMSPSYISIKGYKTRLTLTCPLSLFP
jgi:hypothetical protein